MNGGGPIPDKPVSSFSWGSFFRKIAVGIMATALAGLIAATVTFVLGGMLGTGLGAIGGAIGGPGGAVIGMAVGVAVGTAVGIGLGSWIGMQCYKSLSQAPALKADGELNRANRVDSELYQGHEHNGPSKDRKPSAIAEVAHKSDKGAGSVPIDNKPLEQLNLSSKEKTQKKKI